MEVEADMKEDEEEVAQQSVNENEEVMSEKDVNFEEKVTLHYLKKFFP